MKTRRLLSLLLVAMLSLSLLLSGCGGSKTEPTIKDAPAEYDFDSNSDYVFKVDLKDYTDYALYIDGTRLDKVAEYSCNTDTGEFTVSAYSLIFFEVGQTCEFKVETGGGSVTFPVKMVSGSNLSMDTKDVQFDFKNPADVVISADLGDSKIEEIRVGNKDYATEDQYEYSEKEKTLTLKKELLQTLTGTTSLLVRLDNGKEMSIDVVSTLLAGATFEKAENNALLTNTYGMFWGADVQQKTDANGNNLGMVRPEYDHLFVFGDHYWGVMGGVKLEKGTEYTMEFDVRPDESSTVKEFTIYLRKAFDTHDPRCGLDPSGEGDDVQKYYTLDFTNGCEGKGTKDFVTYTYDESTGMTHVVVKFKTTSSFDMILNANTGGFYFDGERPGEYGVSSDPTNGENKLAYESAKGICWLFDNISVVQE